MGYEPQDDGEAYAAELRDWRLATKEVAAQFHGGTVCALGFTADPLTID